MRAAIHEIRNHLAVAIGGIEACLDKKWEPSDAHLSGVLQALREVDALIDDLPRDRTIEFETRLVTIDVCRLIRNELTAMEGFALERGVGLKVKTCDGIQSSCARFFGDPVRISEIVTNVLTNAIRYTPAGGTVTVDCGRDANSLVFRVTDDGPGVREDERAKIFERGFRGSAGAGLPGSGIGLALVKDFVERQGGSIDVSDGAGHGATFTVRLPGASDGAGCAGCEACGATDPAVVEATS